MKVHYIRDPHYIEIVMKHETKYFRGSFIGSPLEDLTVAESKGKKSKSQDAAPLEEKGSFTGSSLEDLTVAENKGKKSKSQGAAPLEEKAKWLLFILQVL
uniref:H/ACA ribonucleoprotein complex subunit n=1 Tax=Steinernema glaseri TaxID=37863 RepID=A0A1I7ZPK8_9BILA